MDCFGFFRGFNRDSLKKIKRTIAKNNNSIIYDIPPSSHPGATSSAVLKSQTTSPHRYEGGRRFHADESIPYILPSDAQEDDRLHLQHWAIKLAFGSNFDAPVQHALEHGIDVLDSACGPGTWMLEMANMFPNSKFHGTDISTRFPDQIKPGNSEFRVHNIVNDPPFEKDCFGYIHQRLVVLSIKIDEWPTVLENLKLTLKPGGWIELTEFSFAEAYNLGPVTKKKKQGFKLMAAGGMDPDLGSNLTKLLLKAGFINIQKRSVDFPINHGGKLGELFWYDFKEGLVSSKLAYTKIHSEFEKPGVYEKFLEDMGEECKTNKTTIQWTRAIAQKPLRSDT
ncbi:S-adenosyl-L-methionine-dependent methyltransferase [Dichotomocladium elegans]|nr:S-adenosyl-L-methionine-dependent methyltransferase [Dichotomocladium elegans]